MKSFCQPRLYNLIAAIGLEVDQILTRVNRLLIDDLGDGCFVTLLLAFMDRGTRSLMYTGAGQIPGYVLSTPSAV
jgi:serine phosphatase RsbU (regulator of sigma subunit)